jgi:hypothetical protein
VYSYVGGGSDNIAGISGTVSSVYNAIYTGGTFSGYYGSYSPTSTNSGFGVNGTFSFYFDGTNTLSNVYVNTPGYDYVNGDTLLFSGSLFGGTPIVDDVTIQIGTSSIGDESFIGGGRFNITSGNYTTIGGGRCNTVNNQNGGILGGCNNQVINDGSFIIGNGITSTAANTTHVNCLHFSNIPTSSAGLAPGTVWNNGGVLNIV